MNSLDRTKSDKSGNLNHESAGDCSMNGTETREEVVQDIVDIYKAADPFKQFVITVLLKASAKNDTAPLYALIKACPRNKAVKNAARTVIALIEKELASKEMEA